MTNLNNVKWIDKKCPNCGGEMYKDENETHVGIFCINGDYADIDVKQNKPKYQDWQYETIPF